MPSLKTIRKRIASAKATQKITRAMKMVAGARLDRAQQRIVAMRPYAVKTGEVLVGRAHDGVATPSDDRASTRCSRGGPRRRRSSSSYGRPRALRRAQHEHRQGSRARMAGEGTAHVGVSFATMGRKGSGVPDRAGGYDRS